MGRAATCNTCTVVNNKVTMICHQTGKHAKSKYWHLRQQRYSQYVLCVCFGLCDSLFFESPFVCSLPISTPRVARYETIIMLRLALLAPMFIKCPQPGNPCERWGWEEGAGGDNSPMHFNMCMYNRHCRLNALHTNTDYVCNETTLYWFG